MLEPSSRRLLLDSLHPPDGFRLDWAVGTTYSLDLLAILSAPVAFAFSDWHDQEGRATMDPLALLKAVRQYADRICLFCQAGKIHVPKSYQPLLVDLEASIVEVNAPDGGSFHPKIWFLRYIDDDNSVTWRMLCLSRNMTFDRCWDTMLNLEGPLRADRKLAFSRNNPIGDFAGVLPAMAIRKLAPHWKTRLAQLADEIRRVEFETPEPFEDIVFWPLGVGLNKAELLDYRFEKMLVISPFVDDGVIEAFADRNGPVQLVSRPENLALLQQPTLQKIDKVWIMDETADAEPSEDDSEIPLLGLHAKLYVEDHGWNSSVWTGSANATMAGFKRNVELLVELQGKRSQCGVDAVLGKPKDATKHAACLADLLRPYIPGEPVSAERIAEMEFERGADRLAKSMAAAAPESHCEKIAGTDDSASFAVTLRRTGSGKLDLPAGSELRAWPISLSESVGVPVALRHEIWARFEQVSFAGLTPFVAFELVENRNGWRRRFVLNAPLVGAPADRREYVLRQLLSDPDRVLRFLMLLLLDHRAADFAGILNGATDRDGADNSGHWLFESTLFESLVRALDRDPERLDHVAQVVSDLRKTPEGATLLPARFDEIWEPIWTVRQKQLDELK